MTRPLRVDVEDGWYHVTSRGIDRSAIFSNDAEHDAETVSKRLATLREYQWSSYRAYAGYAKGPAWLRTADILQRADRNKAQCVERYRSDIQHQLSKGGDPLLRERLADGFALGSEAFRELIRKRGKGGREIAGSRRLRPRVQFDTLVACIEHLRGENFAAFMMLRGDWAKPLLLLALRRYSGMTLAEIGEAVGGMDYTAVAMAIKRFELRAEEDLSLRQLMQKVTAECEK